jgi:hypothetical protein
MGRAWFMQWWTRGTRSAATAGSRKHMLSFVVAHKASSQPRQCSGCSKGASDTGLGIGRQRLAGALRHSPLQQVNTQLAVHASTPSLAGLSRRCCRTSARQRRRPWPTRPWCRPSRRRRPRRAQWVRAAAVRASTCAQAGPAEACRHPPSTQASSLRAPHLSRARRCGPGQGAQQTRCAPAYVTQSCRGLTAAAKGDYRAIKQENGGQHLLIARTAKAVMKRG